MQEQVTHTPTQAAQVFFERLGLQDEEAENRELDRLMEMYRITPSRADPRRSARVEKPLRIAYG